MDNMDFLNKPDFIDKPKIEKQNWYRYANEHIHYVIDQLRASDKLFRTRFHFIHVNHYCFIENKGYVPCEIGISEFCILEGVTRTWHRFINPGQIPVGYGSEVNDHKEETHKLSWPLPLEAKAKPLRDVYEELIKFIRNTNHESVWSNNTPPLFTLNYNEKFVNIADNERIVTDVLNSMCAQSNSEVRFSVYPAVKLYNELRNSCALYVGREYHESLDVSQKEMEKDIFQNRQSLACEYHISLDAIEHCSRSFVLRWSYTVLGDCCPILNVSMLSEKHMPHSPQVKELPEVIVDAYWSEPRFSDKRGPVGKNIGAGGNNKNERNKQKFANESPKKINEYEKSSDNHQKCKEEKSDIKNKSNVPAKDDHDVLWEWEKPISRNRINTPLAPTENYTKEHKASFPKTEPYIRNTNQIEPQLNCNSQEYEKCKHNTQKKSCRSNFIEGTASHSEDDQACTVDKPTLPTIRKPHPETIKEAIRTCRPLISLMMKSGAVEPEYFAIHNNCAFPYNVTKPNITSRK